MKVLYISSTKAGMFSQSIYYDLMQEFVRNGHDVFCAYANEKRFGEITRIHKEKDITYLGIKTGNLTKNPNLITKGIATLRIDTQFKSSIDKYFRDVTFDLVLVSTPPITFTKTLAYFNKKSVLVYLMLKDIFPQNAVDLGMFAKDGILHRVFQRKEYISYSLANRIGCMSPANRDYIIHHFPEFQEKVDLLPNSIKIVPTQTNKLTKKDYGIEENDVMLLYGGNIGLPQGPNFILECMRSLESLTGVKLVIAGSGSHSHLVDTAIIEENLKNTIYLGQLDIDKYNALTSVCDVGLIFLDYRFTIPNYPQRLLSYMKEAKPVICATDPITDIGTIAEAHGYGYCVESNDVNAWIQAIEKICSNSESRVEMGIKAFAYLEKHYDVRIAYANIMKQIEEIHYV